MKDIGRRIAEIRRERGYNQEQLSEMARVSRITLARYETGAIEPGAFAISRIADALNVSTDELLCRTEKLPPFIPIVKRAVPIVGDIACGEPITHEQNIEGYADIPDGVHADFALRCKGDSMIPTFLDGDLVLIRQQPEAEDGQIAAVSYNGESTLKHIYKNGTGFMLTADNPKFPPIQIMNYEDIVIYGVAVGYVRLFGKG